MAGTELSENSGKSELRLEDASKAALKFLTGDTAKIDTAKSPDLKPVGEAGLSKLEKEPFKEMKPLGQFSAADVGNAVEKGLQSANVAKQLSSTDWKEAEPKFKAANLLIRDQIMQAGGGATFEQSFGSLDREVSLAAQRVAVALSDFRDGRRDLPANGKSLEQQEAETSSLRAKLSGVPDERLLSKLSQEELKQVLTDVETKILDKSKALSDLTQAYFLTNAMYFESASQHALKTGDKTDKAAVVNLIRASQADLGSHFPPAFRGALLQAGEGLPVDFSEGKAEAVAYVKSASDNTSGDLAAEVYAPRFLFGEGERDTSAQNALAMAIIVNKDTARETVDLIKRQQNEVLKSAVIGTLDVGVSYFTAQGLGTVLSRYASAAPWWAKPLAAVGGVAAGGLNDNLLWGRNLADRVGYQNSAFASALVYAPGKLITRLPEASISLPKSATFVAAGVSSIFAVPALTHKTNLERNYRLGEGIAGSYLEKARRQLEMEEQQKKEKQGN